MIRDDRKAVALAILRGFAGDEIILPVRALGELFVVLTRKAKRPAADARAAVVAWADAFPVVETTPAVMVGAQPEQRLGQLDWTQAEELAMVRRGRHACLMAGDLLSPADRAHSLVMMRRQLNSAVHRRTNALLLPDDGWTSKRVAEALFIDAETVREHRRLYASAGRGRIERLAYTGHAPVLTAEQSAELAAELSARVNLSAKAVCGLVAERFDLFYTPNAMAKLLGRMGFVWKRPKCIPAKADAEAQRVFLADRWRH